ncbi:MAG TPA: hypothetical protein VLX61_06330 [Anaerolineales bacterium]|nr:hypothetical protein [Anaerolineales bacterium]
MNKNPSVAILSLTMLFALIISAVLTTPVFADSGTTPPTPPPAAGSTRNSHPSSNNLSGVPSGTKVVIVDDQGNKLALGSQQAQDLLNSGDPVWCPSTVTAPIPGSGGCTPSGINTLYELISDIDSPTPSVAQPAANGTIWITATDESANPIVINGNSPYLSTWAGFSLTLQGGWSGIPGSKTPPSGQSEFTQSISIINWKNSVTVNNIYVHSTTVGNGLTVTTSSNITLNTVTSSNNTDSTQGMGADLDNTSGTGTVTVNKSEFDANAGTGLSVLSHGAITVSNLTALNGKGQAALLDNCVEAAPPTPPCTTTTAQPVTVSGVNQINSNNLYGLEIESTGAVTVNSLTADSNPSGYGLYVDNCHFYEYDTVNHLWKCSSPSAQKVSLTGTNTLNSDFGGLFIDSSGAIALNSVTVDDTAKPNQIGAYLDNCFEVVSNTPPCTTTAQPVTLTGINTFNGNAGTGIYILSSGLITNSSSSLTADGNQGWGALWQNDGATTAVGVTMSGTGEFNNNEGDGLNVHSKSTITFSTSTLNANGNGWTGLLLDSTASSTAVVTLKGTNQFNGNGLNGLQVLSNGNISVNNVNASANGANYSTYNLSGGVYLDNIPHSGTSTPSITITGSNTFIGNYESGLVAISDGSITASNLNASGNGLQGYVPGSSWSGAVLSDNDISSALPKTVSVTGTNTFNNNYDNGLFVQTTSAITTSNITAGGNINGTGAYLDNCFGTSTCLSTFAKTLTMNGINTFNTNGGDGLDAYSDGAIKVNGVLSLNNGAYGTYLENDGAAKAQAVSLTGTSVFSFDGLSGTADGLKVNSRGAISLSSVTADANTGNGLILDNCEETGDVPPCSIATQNVTLAGSDEFNNNGANGLQISSSGTIYLNTSALVSNKNDGGGVALDNSGASTTKAVVTLKGTYLLDWDSDTQLSILSKGAITVGNITALNSFFGSGVSLVNDTLDVLGAVGGVTLSGVNTFNGNAEDGLSVVSSGAVALGNVTANGNDTTDSPDRYGLYLDNSSGTGTVTLSGYAATNMNWYGGMDILSQGTIKAVNISATGNQNSNGAVFNQNGLSTAIVSLTGLNIFNNNGGDGLLINSNGAVTLTKIIAQLNGTDGLNVTTPVTLGLTCGDFLSNGGYGVNLDVGAALTNITTLTGVAAFGNTTGQINQAGAGTVNRSGNCTLP